MDETRTVKLVPLTAEDKAIFDRAISHRQVERVILTREQEKRDYAIIRDWLKCPVAMVSDRTHGEYHANKYRPSAAELAQSERCEDLIKAFRREI